jgi:hypothetical protein
MFRSLKLAIFCILALAPFLRAQTPADPPSGPIPSQILSGKKAFISNGGNATLNYTPNLAYDEFYLAMKTWGQYELVLAPADADLAFEITSANPVGSNDPQVRMLILDPKTHVTLWACTEHIQGASRSATARKNFQLAVTDLVEDVKKLMAQPQTAAGPPVPAK